MPALTTKINKVLACFFNRMDRVLGTPRRYRLPPGAEVIPDLSRIDVSIFHILIFDIPIFDVPIFDVPVFDVD